MSKPTDEELVQQVLDAKPGEIVEPSTGTPGGLEWLRETVHGLESLYSVDVGRDVHVPPLLEFQLGRLEMARGKAAGEISGKSRPVWLGIAVAAAVALVAGALVFRGHEPGVPQGGEIVSKGAEPDPDIAVRGQIEAEKALVGNVSAEILAPSGDLRVSGPVLFIWKADPMLKWDVELYRNGEVTPIAKAREVRSPLALEKLFGGPIPASWNEGGDFRWVVKAADWTDEAGSGGFRLAADAPDLRDADTGKVMEALDAAETAGRHAEALMLLFSAHDHLSTDAFMTRRRMLEEKILKP